MGRRGIDWSEAACQDDWTQELTGPLPGVFATLTRGRSSRKTGRSSTPDGGLPGIFAALSLDAQSDEGSWGGTAAGRFPGIFAELPRRTKGRPMAHRGSLWSRHGGASGSHRSTARRSGGCPGERSCECEGCSGCAGRSTTLSGSRALARPARNRARGDRGGASTRGRMSPHPDDTGIPDYPECYDGDGYLIGCCWEDCHGPDCLDPDSEECDFDDDSESTASTGAVAVLDPPARSEWDGTCEHKMEGNRSLCTALLDARSIADFYEMDVEGYADTVVIKGFGEDGEDLLLHAWALLNENTDLIRYAVCWATGNEEGADEIIAHLRRTRSRVNIKAEDGSRCTEHWAFLTSSADIGGGGTIKVCVNYRFWQTALENWTSASRSDRPCSVLEVAVALLHELAHVAWRGLADAWEFLGTCRKPQLIENVFRWAMYQRYAWIESSECCDGQGTDKQFGSNEYMVDFACD